MRGELLEIANHPGYFAFASDSGTLVLRESPPPEEPSDDEITRSDTGSNAGGTGVSRSSIRVRESANHT